MSPRWRINREVLPITCSCKLKEAKRRKKKHFTYIHVIGEVISEVISDRKVENIWNNCLKRFRDSAIIAVELHGITISPAYIIYRFLGAQSWLRDRDGWYGNQLGRRKIYNWYLRSPRADVVTRKTFSSRRGRDATKLRAYLGGTDRVIGRPSGLDIVA